MTLREILTPRQFQLANLVWNGMSNKEIAAHMGVKIDTVKHSLTRIFNTGGVGCDTRLELGVRYEREEGKPVVQTSAK
jgi:DNA-binding NarL/FixJ family response regulator